MKAPILDSRKDGNGKCYLCKIMLEDYITSLPDTYQDYEIQREIVTNVYLDQLVETVLARRHIPPIVLVVEKGRFRETKATLEIDTFKILDGLQRTFRLKAIRSTIDYALQLDKNEDFISWTKYKLSKSFSNELRKINSTTEVLRAILVFKAGNNQAALLETFKNNPQWFEVWTGLSEDEEVKKMLVLNAGHKPVKTRHQLELLFLNLLPLLRVGEGAEFQLVRERDISATQFSKAREIGSFHFAHIVASLLSLHEGKPISPSTSLIQAIQSSDSGIEEYSDLTTPEFLKNFVASLVRLDKLVAQQYPEIGIFWMGREVTLAGLFGAIGDYAKSHEEAPGNAIRRLVDIVKDHPKVLRLDEFEAQRNSLDLSKVNIGNINRAAVFSATRELLEKSGSVRIDWSRHFGVSK
jgi:hypothetical protein